MLNRYIIKGGTLVSILDGSENRKDILVENGIITKIEEELEEPGAEIINACGSYISIGWLEAHSHISGNASSLAIDPDRDLLMQGVTYALDLGTVGPCNYLQGRSEALYKSNLRTMGYLNISNNGLCAGQVGKTKDFDGPQDIEPDRIRKAVNLYHSELLGLKARIDEKFCFDPIYVMDQLRSLGDELTMPIAVHAPRSLIGIERLLTYMKKGDVLCHTLAGNSDVMSVIDKNGSVKECVLESQKKGVIFDLSHGTNAYSYRTAEAAWKCGFFVNTISSDLHSGNINGPVYSTGTVLTKMHGLTGKPWHWLLNRLIVQPVLLQHIPNKAVEIKIGMTADFTVYKLEKGSFTYLDSKQESRTFAERIAPDYTCLGTSVYVCRHQENAIVK